jgi:hypothetical protein
MTHGGDRKSDQAAALPLVSQAEAGKQVGVSERSIRDAVRVLSKAEPEIVKAADNGRLPVSAAAKVAEHPPEVQRQAVASIDQGAKPAAVVRALPTSSGKAKPNAPAPAKLSREQKTPHEKATDVWVEMISLEARWREWREWQDEHDGEALWSFAPSEFWPLLNYDMQEEMVRIAKVLVPWLTAIIEQAAPQKKTAASSTIVAKPKLVKSKGERVM